jgi:uncharacterized protein (TIGR01777 family)
VRIVVAGSSGFLGSNLRSHLASAGHDLVQLVRRSPGPGQARWAPERRELDPALLAGADAVVNLAGAGVEDKRWSDEFKRTLVQSRVEPTTTIAGAIAALPAADRPGVLLNASAIGYYGATGDSLVDESAPAGVGFFPDLCQDWEAATDAAVVAGVRVVKLRTGLVLDVRGGLLRPLALVFRLFAGGPLAGGRQWMSWISLADWLAAVDFLLEREDISGPVNVVGPEPVRNTEFTRALAQAVHRPAFLPVPAFALRIVLGEFAGESVASQRILPAVLNRSGFAFAHRDIDAALRSALGPKPR